MGGGGCLRPSIEGRPPGPAWQKQAGKGHQSIGPIPNLFCCLHPPPFRPRLTLPFSLCTLLPPLPSGPDYKMHLPVSNMENLNSKPYLETIKGQLFDILRSVFCYQAYKNAFVFLCFGWMKLALVCVYICMYVYTAAALPPSLPPRPFVVGFSGLPTHHITPPPPTAK